MAGPEWSHFRHHSAHDRVTLSRQQRVERKRSQIGTGHTEAQQRSGHRTRRGADDDVGRARVPPVLTLERGEHSRGYACPITPPAPRTSPTRVTMTRRARSVWETSVAREVLAQPRLKGRGSGGRRLPRPPALPGRVPTVEVTCPFKAQVNKARRSEARGVTLLAEQDDLLVVTGDLGQPVLRRRVEAPFEDVALDDERPGQ